MKEISATNKSIHTDQNKFISTLLSADKQVVIHVIAKKLQLAVH